MNIWNNRCCFLWALACSYHLRWEKVHGEKTIFENSKGTIVHIFHYLSFVSSYSVGFHNAIEKAEHMLSRFLLFVGCLFVPIVFFPMFCLHTLQVDVNDTYGTYEYDTSYEQSDYSTVQDTNDYYEPTYDDM